MKKSLSLFLFMLAVAVNSYANPIDSLANYEPNSGLVPRTFSWTGSDIDVVGNPVSDAVNSSSGVLEFTRSSQYSSAFGVNNFGNNNSPRSLFQYPIVKLKAMSETTTGTTISVSASDINGYNISVEQTMPANTNKWADFEFDFTSHLLSTPISFIVSITIQINYGNATTGEKYYVDDIVLSGPEVTSIDESTVLTLFQEQYSGNAWWIAYNGNPRDTAQTIDFFRTAQWGGSALTGSVDHYVATDSMMQVMVESGLGSGKLFPTTERAGLSYIEFVDFTIAGLDNLSLSYDLQWVTAPSAYTSAITVEYQLDGGSWTELTTSSTLPSATGSWTTDITYDFPSLVGDTISFRLTNNETASLYVDNISLSGTKVFASSIDISAPDTIIHTGDSIQFVSAVGPANANQATYWYISAGDTAASIDPTTGVLTTHDGQCGVATVTAIALDITGRAEASKAIYVYYPVESIHVRNEYGITELLKGVSTTMYADVYPLDSANASVVWSSSADTVVTIDGLGNATAVGEGIAWIKAVAVDGGQSDSIMLTVTTERIWSELAVGNIVVGTVDSPEDFTGHVEMSWDADSVYMVFVIVDDSITAPFEGQWGPNSYACDNIEIYFDMDNSKNIHWPRNGGWMNNDPTFDDNDYQLRLNPNYGPAFSGADFPVSLDSAITDTGYTFSIGIPWDSLMNGFNAVAGTQIGFDLLISDNDVAESGDGRNQITYNSFSDKAFNDPSLWATFELAANGSFIKIADTEVPTAPLSLAGTDSVITWDASADNIAVYQYVLYNGNTEVDTIYAKETGNTYTFVGLEEGSYTISVVALDNYNNASEKATIDLTVSSGEPAINITEMSTFNVYPNPSKGIFNILSDGASNVNIAVYDLAGQQIYTDIFNGNYTLDLTHAHSGMYIVHLNNGAKVEVVNLIVR